MKKRILLLGAGHANIQVLHNLSRLSADTISVTLISDVIKSPYSGMIPSFMADVYSESDLQFDVQQICKRFQFEFVHAAVECICPAGNFVQTAAGKQFFYDICSVNLGIRPAEIAAETANDPRVIYLKPISQFIHLWKKLCKEDVRKIMVIGGGAGAFEVAIACRRKFADADIVVVTGQRGLLADESKKLQDYAKFKLNKQKIKLFEYCRVEKINGDHVQLSDKVEVKRQFCLIATAAQVSPIFKNSGLPTTGQGFVRVDQFLRIEGYNTIFATGDCCDFAAAPLPKAGVFAVRQGPVVFENIQALINDQKKLKPYRPQKNFLKIMVSGNDQAIATYKNFHFKGWFAWKLKDYIDRRFMRRFQ